MKIIDKYKWGKNSERRKQTTSFYLQLCSNRMIARTPVDCCVPWMGGIRTAEDQNKIFKNGNSKADGYNKISNHQLLDKEGLCMAIDIVPFVNGKPDYKAYGRFGIIGTLMLDCWEELKKDGLIPSGLYLHWGGLWSNKNKDLSKLGWDMAHYEVRDYPQNYNLK